MLLFIYLFFPILLTTIALFRRRNTTARVPWKNNSRVVFPVCQTFEISIINPHTLTCPVPWTGRADWFRSPRRNTHVHIKSSRVSSARNVTQNTAVVDHRFSFRNFIFDQKKKNVTFYTTGLLIFFFIDND